MSIEISTQDQPTIPDILRVVREYLESIVDRVPDDARYHAMCSVYLLSVAEREITTEAIAGLKARLESVIGQVLPLTDAMREFSHQIREGDCDSRWDEVFTLILDQVISKVRISKPEHLNEMHQE